MSQDGSGATVLSRLSVWWAAHGWRYRPVVVTRCGAPGWHRCHVQGVYHCRFQSRAKLPLDDVRTHGHWLGATLLTLSLRPSQVHRDEVSQRKVHYRLADGMVGALRGAGRGYLVVWFGGDHD